MIDNIYVFDDIIEKPYQELIKETLLGGDKPPTVNHGIIHQILSRKSLLLVMNMSLRRWN